MTYLFLIRLSVSIIIVVFVIMQFLLLLLLISKLLNFLIQFNGLKERSALTLKSHNLMVKEWNPGQQCGNEIGLTVLAPKTLTSFLSVPQIVNNSSLSASVSEYNCRRLFCSVGSPSRPRYSSSPGPAVSARTSCANVDN